MQKIFSALQLKLSRSEICVANFIPPVSQNDYFLPKSIHQNYQVLLKLQIQKKIQFFILNIDPCKSWDNWGQSLSQTDRKTNSLTPYTGVCGFFIPVKFTTCLLVSFAGDQKILSANGECKNVLASRLNAKTRARKYKIENLTTKIEWHKVIVTMYFVWPKVVCWQPLRYPDLKLSESC